MSESVPVVASRFDPSGQWLATVIPSLDIHKLRIHSVIETLSQSLKSDLDLPKGIKVHSLEWIVSGLSSGKSIKKRKRSSITSSSVPFEDFLIAIGTSTGSIVLFSPSKNSVVHTLESGHSVAVTSISQDASLSNINELFTCDVSGQVSKWDLSKSAVSQKFKAPEQGTEIVQALSGSSNKNEQVLLASTVPYLVDVASPSKVIRSYSDLAHSIDMIQATTQEQGLFLTASTHERNIIVSSISKEQPVSILVAQSDVRSLSLNDKTSALAVSTDDGAVEIFFDPFRSNGSSPSKSKRSSKASLASSSDISVRVVRPYTGKASPSPVKIESVVFDKNYLVVYWLENGSVPVFEKVQWLQENGKPVETKLIEITRARLSASLKPSGANKSNGVDSAAVIGYSEAASIVTSGKDVNDIESDEEEEQEESLAERLESLEVDHGSEKQVNGKSKSATNATKNIFATPGSFAVILNQALKTNDHSLLETCLSARDDQMIKVSVQRLDSALAIKLLERLAEKMSRTPARAGQLNIWIKWVMIAHGGYIVTIPNLLKSLSSLHSILADRVSTLPRLLALQGRLEMLRSQMELRRDIKSQSGVGEYHDNEEDEETEEARVEYIEDGEFIVNGEEDFDDNLEDDDEEDDVDEEDEEMSDNGFIQLEAEESAGDSEEEESESGFSDVEDDGDDVSDEESDLEVAPAPVAKSKKISSRS